MDRKPHGLRRAKEKLFALLKLKKRSVPRVSLPISEPEPEPAAAISPPISEPEPTITTPILSASKVSTQIATGIEALPLELKLYILCAIPNVQTLKCLLKASPGCYQALRSSKCKVLKAVILNGLSPSLLVEAKAVCKAKRVPRDENWLACVGGMVQEWKDEKQKIEGRAANGEDWKSVEVEENDVVDIANRVLLVEELTTEYCRDALRPVAGRKARKDKEKGEWDGDISEMERHRLQRAMYRLETFAALFREKNWNATYRPREFCSQEIANLYFGNSGLKPWEVEELACVRDWMYRIYGSMLKDTKDLIYEMDLEVERDELRYDVGMEDGEELEKRAKGYVAERGEHWEREQCEILMMLGLPFLAEALRAGSTEDKFDLLEKHLVPSIRDAPYFLTSALLADEPGGAVHGHGHRRPRLEFEGDTGSGPNSAWVLSKKYKSRREQCCWFEDAAELWREWGYCLWDETRLKSWGFGDWSWRDGRRKQKGSWVYTEQVRPSGRVLIVSTWVPDGRE